MPAKVQKRARILLADDPITVIDQTLHSIWQSVSGANRRGEKDIDEAILGAQALLAMLNEMKKAAR